MSLLVILAVLIACAVTAPFFGADTRWLDASVEPNRPKRGKRYRQIWDGAIAEEVHQRNVGRTR